MPETVVGALAVAALAGSFLLLWSAAGHLQGFGLLRATIVGHDIVPYRWHRQVAQAFVVAELTIGVVVVASWLFPGAPLALIVGLTAQAALYVLFCGYATLVLRTGRSAACGCFADDESITWATPLRAGALALATTVAAFAVSPGSPGGSVMESAVIAALALGATVVLRHLPRLVRAPERTRAA